MNTTPEVKHLLKALRLSGILSTLPDRVSYAAGNKLTHQEFLELVLSDELERRRHGALGRRLQNAGVNLDQVMERFDWDAKITLDRERLKSLLGLEFIDRNENAIMTGPVGVGKTYLANALAHAACRREKSVIVRKAASGLAPSPRAASSTLASRPRRLAVTARIMNGTVSTVCPTMSSGSEGLRSMLAKNWNREIAMIISGTTIGISVAMLNQSRPRNR